MPNRADQNQAITNRGNEAYQAARSRSDRDRRTVYGTRQHETLRGANNNINFFVFRVDKEIPTEDIKTYLSEEGIQNTRSKSFKVSVKLQDKDKIMSPDFGLMALHADYSMKNESMVMYSLDDRLYRKT